MDDYVSFEVAKKLKEKGFNEYSDMSYTKIGLFNNTETYKESKEFYCYAPTISQVLKWLREEKEIDIVIYPIDACTVFMGGEKYILSVYTRRKRDYKLHHNNKDKYVKWENAALAGIEYVLDNLI